MKATFLETREMTCRKGHEVHLGIDAQTVTTTMRQKRNVRKPHLNIFDSSVSDLQQGWRLVVAVCRRAQAELEL